MGGSTERTRAGCCPQECAEAPLGSEFYDPSPVSPWLSRSWESGDSILGSVCLEVSGGLLQRAGSSETTFSAAPENGLACSLQSGRSSKFMYLEDIHGLILIHQTYVDVQCEWHVLNSLQIWTHLIIQQLHKVGIVPHTILQIRKRRQHRLKKWSCARNMLGELDTIWGKGNI